MTDLRNNSTQVTLHCEHAAPIVYSHFPRYTMWMGTVQIVCSIAMFVLGVACIFHGAPVGVYGVQIFIPAVLAGAFGIAAGKSKGICQITTTMIFSILNSISSCAVVVIMVQALSFNEFQDDDFNDALQAELQSEYGYPKRPNGRTLLIFVLVFALVEAVTSIVLSTVGCHFSCFCCKNCCCRFDLTATEQVLVRDSNMEQQLQLLCTADPAVAQAIRVPKKCDQDREMLIQPPSYNDV